MLRLQSRHWLAQPAMLARPSFLKILSSGHHQGNSAISSMIVNRWHKLHVQMACSHIHLRVTRAQMTMWSIHVLVGENTGACREADPAARREGMLVLKRGHNQRHQTQQYPETGLSHVGAANLQKHVGQTFSMIHRIFFQKTSRILAHLYYKCQGHR